MAPTEDLESFRQRARDWLAANMPRLPEGGAAPRRSFSSNEEDTKRALRARELQKILWAGGFAGICFPAEYGGLGLPIEYQKAFTRESSAYEMPIMFNVPTFAICGATILQYGTDEQKKQHIPPMLKGDNLWVQYLSEPTGGSDVAGAITSAVRDGEQWVINGSKIWSTYAAHSDWALLLARTDWDVPKHRGLSAFMMRTREPGVELHQIKMVNGSEEFCQEFFDDVRLPAEALLGEVNGGWTVMTGWLFNERNSVGGGSPYVSGSLGHGGDEEDSRAPAALGQARAVGNLSDPRVRDLIGEAYAIETVGRQMISRIGRGIVTGTMKDTASSILRLYSGVAGVRRSTIGLEIVGADAVTWSDEDIDLGGSGMDYIMRQASCIGGGTTEIARNIISERVLSMPREPAPDRDRPFREVRTNTVAR